MTLEGMTAYHWFAVVVPIISFAVSVGIALLMSVKTTKENKDRLAALGEQVGKHSIQLAGLEGLPRVLERQFERLDHLNSDVGNIKGTLTQMNTTLGHIQRAMLGKDDA